MDENTVEESTMTAIADAIRAKYGNTNLMTPADMLEILRAMVYPNGTLQVSVDGTYDVTNYASAVVSVGGSASRFSFSWNENTGMLSITDEDNPFPDGIGEEDA